MSTDTPSPEDVTPEATEEVAPVEENLTPEEPFCKVGTQRSRGGTQVGLDEMGRLFYSIIIHPYFRRKD